MAIAGVFDIELNEDGADDSDHSDEEPIKPASEQHVQVKIVDCLVIDVVNSGNWTFRPFVSSPPPPDDSPPRRFAPGRFAPWMFRPHVMDVSPP